MAERLGADVFQAYEAADAIAALHREHFDLVFVNRKLDSDYSDGTDLIKKLKDDPKTASVPVMLVSNYPEAQAEAVSLGAVYGFGKMELAREDVHRRILQALDSSPQPAKASD